MNQDINTLAAETPTVIALRSKTQGLLEPRLKLVFEEMAEHLFNLSASAQLSAENRSRSFECFSMLRAQHKSLIKTLLARIDRGFDKLVAVNSDTPAETLPTELDLVDLNEFESNLAIDRMVKLGTDRYWLTLEAITLRLAAAIDAEPKKIQLPFGLKVCFGGYRSVLAPLEFNDDIMSELDKAFARALLPELKEVYQQINSQLAAAGLLPDIEKELENGGSKLGAKPEEARSTKAHSPTHGSSTDAVYEEAPPEQGTASHLQDFAHSYPPNQPPQPTQNRTGNRPDISQSSHHGRPQQTPIRRTSSGQRSYGSGNPQVPNRGGETPYLSDYPSDVAGDYSGDYPGHAPNSLPNNGPIGSRGGSLSGSSSGSSSGSLSGSSSGSSSGSPSGFPSDAPSGSSVDFTGDSLARLSRQSVASPAPDGMNAGAIQGQSVSASQAAWLSSDVSEAIDRSPLALSPLDEEAYRQGYRNYLPSGSERRPNTTVGAGILNRLRSQQNYGVDSTTAPTAEQVVTQSRALVDRLVDMRQNGVRWSPQSGTLIEELGLAGDDSVNVSPAAGSVALVDQLFTTLSTVVPSNPPVINSLYSLKLPLAQLSLTEPDFYRNREHPARLLIERLTELAALTPQGNTRIEAKLNDVLERLNTSYDGTHDAFDKALAKVTELALGALRQQQKAIQRQIAADDGREKRRVAQDVVARGLATAMPQKSLPRLLLDIVDTALRDALTLRVLRSGTDAQYLDVLAALGRLNSALQGEHPLDSADAERSLAVIRACLSESELLNADSERLVRDIEAAMKNDASPDLAASPLLHTDIYLEPYFSERLASLPRLGRWVKRARELPINSWLSNIDEGGIVRNHQLIWRNEAGTRFTLANEQGQGIEHLDLLALAKRLANRLQPLKASEQLSIIERSVFSTLEEKQTNLLSMSRAQSGEMLSRSELEDKVQSMLRRARRQGASHVAAAVTAGDESLLAGLIDALRHAGLSVESYGRLRDALFGLIIDSQSTETVQNALATLNPTSASTKHGVAMIDPRFKDAQSVWQGLEDYLDGAFAGTDVIIEEQPRQKDLAAAVVKIYSHLCDEMPPRFSLRELVRQGTHDAQNSQQIFQVLLDGTADTGAEVTRQSGYHSTALAIALDCAKIAGVTQLAERLTDAGREVPVFNIRIATDAALHHDFLEFVLKAVSDSGIGTDRLCIELCDSTRLREASRVADFARALRSIGCQICIANVHPSRGSTAQLQALSPHMLILDASLWPPEEGNHLASLNQAISDLHHLVGEHVVLRDDRDTTRAAELGIDIIESLLSPEIDPQQLTQMLPSIER